MTSFFNSLSVRAMTTKESFGTNKAGAFQREDSVFRHWIEPNADAEFPAEKDRYHLYISYACPWASRCLMALHLKGLDKIIGLSVVHSVFQRTRPNDANDVHAGWAFVDPAVTPSLPGPTGLNEYSSAGSIPDTVNSARFARDLYDMCYNGKTRYTVPILWDKKKKMIVSNESADIVRMLNTAFEGIVPSTVDLYPEALRAQIDEVNEWVYHDISNGVYKCGFAQSQGAYNDAVKKLFEGLDRVESILSKQRYLAGNVMTEADVRLFTTLVRFDEVYFVHFKTNKKHIYEYPNMINYVRDIYQKPGISQTVHMDHIKNHYYGSHTHINTFGIVPAGGEVDFTLPHDRARFGASTKRTIPQNFSQQSNFESFGTNKAGAFQREDSVFRHWIEPNADAEFPAEKDRYHLYISYACPWASRCLMALHLKGLDKIIGLSVVHSVFQRTRPNDANDVHAGWAFVDPAVTPSLPGPTGLNEYSSAGSIPDTVNSARFARDLYDMCYNGKTRYTVPILWDKKKKMIVSNESADIVRMLNTAFEGIVPSTVDLYPEALRAQIDEVNEWVYHDISNGVYKCGFAQSQGAYNDAVKKLFEGLDRVESILSKQRYLAGNVMTEADVRLFTTLVRFDEVYFVHFKTNKKHIYEYPNMINYVRDIYQKPGISQTVHMDHIKNHYYGSHTHINTFGIVPAGGEVDFTLPHDRARFGA
ncbi:TPA: LOW QUALITY PROTEIN: hypothetical protein N0F65_002854 [Lagenidium giganteum]|uniref:GST C-terminal domain-containing protein n=1 Tax=Lagenidium giganteum TaxID=4803 RepID=A0AAV2Z7U0_9STRA|nr:TPA: LOW QUALITY PROTEIN: hypothetical protein N0F65_002854 [Lagenidium giganteum]